VELYRAGTTCVPLHVVHTRGVLASAFLKTDDMNFLEGDLEDGEVPMSLFWC